MEIKVNTRINGKRVVVAMQADEPKSIINEPVLDDSGLVFSEIERLKSELQESDYKVIKCAEAMAVGAKMPYDVTALHKERQALRDKINKLESEVQNG